MINRTINSDVKMSDETITNISKEYILNNPEIYFRGKCGVDDLMVCYIFSKLDGWD